MCSPSIVLMACRCVGQGRCQGLADETMLAAAVVARVGATTPGTCEAVLAAGVVARMACWPDRAGSKCGPDCVATLLLAISFVSSYLSKICNTCYYCSSLGGGGQDGGRYAITRRGTSVKGAGVGEAVAGERGVGGEAGNLWVNETASGRVPVGNPLRAGWLAGPPPGGTAAVAAPAVPNATAVFVHVGGSGHGLKFPSGPGLR